MNNEQAASEIQAFKPLILTLLGKYGYAVPGLLDPEDFVQAAYEALWGHWRRRGWDAVLTCAPSTIILAGLGNSLRAVGCTQRRAIPEPRRGRRSLESVDTADVADCGLTVEEQVWSREVQAIIATLPPRAQTILHALWQGVPQREIARRQGCTEGTLWHRKQVAIGQLRRALGGQSHDHT